MIDEQAIEGLRKRFSHVHPLLFQRSVERAATGGDLFDILSAVTDKYPLIWDVAVGRWATTTDILQTEQFKAK